MSGFMTDEMRKKIEDNDKADADFEMWKEDKLADAKDMKAEMDKTNTNNKDIIVANNDSEAKRECPSCLVSSLNGEKSSREAVRSLALQTRSKPASANSPHLENRRNSPPVFSSERVAGSSPAGVDNSPFAKSDGKGRAK